MFYSVKISSLIVFIIIPNDQNARRTNSPKYIYFLLSTKLGSAYCWFKEMWLDKRARKNYDWDPLSFW